MERTCKKCGETKPIEEFFVYHRAAGFPDPHIFCRKCRNKRSNNYYKNNKKRIVELNTKSRRKHIEAFRKAASRRQKKKVAGLIDDYVMQCIINKTGTNRIVLKQHPELIESERIRIKILRLTK